MLSLTRKIHEAIVLTMPDGSQARVGLEAS
jgi:hypothetical protein